MKTAIKILVYFLFVTQICFTQWFQQESMSDVNLKAVYFVDSLTGWIVGEDSTILHTSNGGLNWISQTSGYSGYDNNYNDVFFPNDISGWIVGGTSYSGIILHTSDGGASWVKQSEEMTRRLNAVFFINDSVGWIGGGMLYPGGKIILKTTNGGTTWDTLLIDLGVPFSSIFDIQFVDDSTGWAVGGIYPGWGGEIFKTVDGGYTWTSQFGVAAPFASCAFISNQDGWVTSAGLMSDGIFNTTNGGTSWGLQYIPDTLTFESINCIEIINGQKGWAVGSKYLDPVESLILHTDNGGLNWNRQNISTNVPLNSVFFIDEYTGWIVGDSGTVLFTNNGGQIFTENETTIQVINTFSLYQNFPNPFNPGTLITYKLLVGSNVTLKVYDILGNEISTLVDEYKPAGKYEIDFNASSLPSGVYFYRLKAGNFFSAKKMILLK